MEPVTINYLAVLLAAVLSMPVGAIWFSSLLFSKSWMKEVGKKTEDMTGGNPMIYILTFAAELITAYVLAHLIQYAQASTIAQAMATAFLAWVGFIAPAMAINYLFEGRSRNLFLITAFHHLAVLLLMGAVLVTWQ